MGPRNPKQNRLVLLIWWPNVARWLLTLFLKIQHTLFARHKEVELELTRKLLCWLAFTVLEHAMLAELTFITSYCHACFLSHDIVFLALITVIVFCSIFDVGELLIWDGYEAPILVPVTCQALLQIHRPHCFAFTFIQLLLLYNLGEGLWSF